MQAMSRKRDGAWDVIVIVDGGKMYVVARELGYVDASSLLGQLRKSRKDDAWKVLTSFWRRRRK